MAEIPLYRFKWDNYDMDVYVKNRQFVAAQLRRDAEILRLRADQIDQECRELEAVLIDFEPETPDA